MSSEDLAPSEGDYVVINTEGSLLTKSEDGFEAFGVIRWPDHSQLAGATPGQTRNAARVEACELAAKHGKKAWDATGEGMQLIDCAGAWTAKSQPAENDADNSPDVGDDTAEASDKHVN